ncbi:MAG: DUF421 domain-containing protein [Caulobacteraceae bacterium]|nr:DUF421 domain-containing protein [Caulobacteraceae bacterium]
MSSSVTSESDPPAGVPPVSPRVRVRRTELFGVGVFVLVIGLGLGGMLGPAQGEGLGLVVRVAVIYVILTLGFRVLGKRELSQLSPFELITVLLVAEIVSPALTAGDETVGGAVIGTATLLLLTFINSTMSYSWKLYRAVGEAPPAVIIRHGRLVGEVLHKDRLRPDEILSEMHKAGISSVEQVRWGFIEPDGKLSFVRADDGDTGSVDDKAVG